MEYEGVNTAECEAVENDWLDISYTRRKYLSDEQQNTTAKKDAKAVRIPLKFGRKAKTILKYVAAAAACCAAMVTLLFFDSNFDGNVFETARATASSSLPVFGGDKIPQATVIELPPTVEISEVKDGVVTFGGGRLVMSFTSGTVSDVTESTVTVKIGDNTFVVYGNVVKTYVKTGDEIEVNAVLAKYNGTATVSILDNGEIVKNVVGSETDLKWSV